MTGNNTILVVDDEPESLKLLMGILTEEGYRVRPADSGELALASVAAEPPELILLDIRMPGLDGFEVCRRLKASEEGRDIPLMFISASTEVEERVEGLARGAVDFIVKPFRREELLARVRTHLELGRLRAHLEMQVARRTAELGAANEKLQMELTERRLIEHALQESEAQLRAILTQAAVGIAQTSIDGEWLFLNDRYCEILGYTQAELLGKTFLDIVHPEEREASLAGIRKLLAGAASPRLVERRCVRKDGTVCWARLFISLVRDQENLPRYFIAVAEDITTHKQTEATLRESEARFRNMADTAPVMIWVSGQDKLFTFFNKTWLDFTGRTLEQELGNGWAAGLHPDDLDCWYEAYRSSFDARRNFQLECRLRRADGEYRSVLCSGVPRFEPGGIFAGYIGSDIDITEEKRADAALRRNLDEIAHLNRVAAMGELTASLVHELNQPLAAILSNAQAASRILSSESADLAEVRGCLADIVADDKRVGEVIARVERIVKKGGASQESVVDLNQVVNESIRLTRNDALLRQVSVKFEPFPDLPPVLGDRVQLCQVVLNLIMNGLDAATSQPPNDRLVLVRTGQPDGDGIELTVEDSGKGIAEGDLDRLFEPLFSTKREGLGMGLSISRSIVRAHGGRLWAENSARGGAIFRCLLPETKQASAASAK